jgi:hypothetical protein
MVKIKEKKINPLEWYGKMRSHNLKDMVGNFSNKVIIRMFERDI